MPVKFLKKILLFLVFLAVLLVVGTFAVLRAHDVQLSDSDLPQDVYETDGDLLAVAELKLAALLLLHPEEPGEPVEEFLNYLILYMIHDKVNPHYDPLDASCDTDACNLISGNADFYVDYAFAALTEENQILLTVGMGSQTAFESRTAVYLYFDWELNYLSAGLTLSLDRCFVATTEISLKTLGWLVDRAGQDAIEDAISFGTLDLDAFTYSVSILDF